MISDVSSSREEKVMIFALKTETGSDLWKRFSTMSQLRRFVAYVLRFKDKTRKLKRRGEQLSSGELNTAEDRIIQLIQKEELSKEINSL